MRCISATCCTADFCGHRIPPERAGDWEDLSTLGAVRKVYFSYTAGAALPIVLWCVQNGQPVYISTATMLGVFVWVVWITSTKYSRSMEAVIRTRNELSEVSTASKRLQESYERLATIEREVRNSEERFRRIFEGGLVGMAILSRKGTIQSVNPALCSFTVYERRQLIGRPCDTLVHPLQLDAMRGHLDSVSNGILTSHQQECRFRHRNGSDVYGLTAPSAILDYTGDVLGTLVQVQDIT